MALQAAGGEVEGGHHGGGGAVDGARVDDAEVSEGFICGNVGVSGEKHVEIGFRLQGVHDQPVVSMVHGASVSVRREAGHAGQGDVEMLGVEDQIGVPFVHISVYGDDGNAGFADFEEEVEDGFAPEVATMHQLVNAFAAKEVECLAGAGKIAVCIGD